MGIPEEDARYFEQGLRAGGVLVTVKAANRTDEARRILRDRGADLEAAGAASASTGQSQQRSEGRQRLELREEELRATKEQVQAGEVRLRKEVVEEKKTIDVPVTREEVVIERRPVSGRTPSDSDITEGEEIRIPVMEEEVRVEKTPVVKEEVTASKRRVEETKQVSDTVRREEARMEETGDAHVSGSGSKLEGWRGNERRYRDDSSYTGPERRLTNV
jgi:uncharacterized protein (TIGR02271 family)